MPSASLRFEPCVAYGELPRPVDAVLVHDVPDKAGHGDAAVLHLGVAQKANSRGIGLVPELSLGQVERVVVALRTHAARRVRHARRLPHVTLAKWSAETFASLGTKCVTVANIARTPRQ